MAIGRFLSEAVAEGIFFRWLLKGWDVLKAALVGGGISGGIQQATGKIIEKALKEDALAKESLFAFLLAEANINDMQRSRIREAVKRLHRKNPIFAKNFRRIVALDATNRGFIKITDKDGKVVEKMDKSYRQPGLSILENLAKCRTEHELDLALLAMGVFNETPNGSIDEFKVWAKNQALPFLSQIINSAGAAVGSVIFEGTNYMNRQYDERIMRQEERAQLKWYQWLNPAVFCRWFLDLF